jgi:hypothetical protein
MISKYIHLIVWSEREVEKEDGKKELEEEGEEEEKWGHLTQHSQRQRKQIMCKFLHYFSKSPLQHSQYDCWHTVIIT